MKRIKALLRLSSSHPLNAAVGKVQRHVNDKPDAEQPGRRQDREQRIPSDCRRGMKRMKSNAAAVGVVNRIGEEMIEVHEHRGQHDEPGPAPLLAEEKPRHGPGNSRVKDEMDDCKFDQSLARRRRRALLTTDTELIAIAAPAKIGESSRPNTG